ADLLATVKLEQVQGLVSVLERRIQHRAAVGAPVGREIDRVIVGDLKFFAAIQMRDENFLETTAAVGHVGDPSIKDSRHSGELVDDFVDKLVRDAPIIPNPSGVALPDALLALINVEEPQLDRNFVALNRESAFDQSFSADRRPVFEIEGPKRNAAGLGIFQ